MAIDNKFQTKSDVEVYIGTEITMGTATLAGGTWDKVPVVDYAIADKQAPLGVAPQRANSFGQQVSGAKHNRTEQMFEVSLTMHGTAGVIDRICGALFEDDDATNTLIGGSPATKTFDDGQSNSVPVTLLFKNGGSDGNDIHFKSAMCTSMELSYGIGTDGGALSCVATFVTGYILLHRAGVSTGSEVLRKYLPDDDQKHQDMLHSQTLQNGKTLEEQAVANIPPRSPDKDILPEDPYKPVYSSSEIEHSEL